MSNTLNEVLSSDIQKIYKELNLFNLNMNKKEDDIKNIITEKDLIINEMNEKLLKQKNTINKNKEKIKNLNKRLNEVYVQLKKFKIFEERIRKILDFDKYERQQQPPTVQSILPINTYNNDINEKEENEDNENNDSYEDYENEDLFYDEYEDILDDNNIILNQKKNKQKKSKKKEKNKTEEKNDLLIEKNPNEKDYILIGKKFPNYNNQNSLKEKIYRFQSNILKTDEQFYLLKKGICMHFPNIKINKLNFDLSGKFNKFPLDISKIKENEELLLNKDLLLLVETLDNNIVALCFNKSYLPQKTFYLFFNENKIYYYKKKINAIIEENEFYRDEIYYPRYRYSGDKIKKIGDLKCFFFEGFFSQINNFEFSKCKEIEIFEILSE